MFQTLHCMFGGHRVSRNRVREHGGDFFGSCVGCGRRLIRDLDGWRPAQPGDSWRPGDPDGGRRSEHKG